MVTLWKVVVSPIAQTQLALFKDRRVQLSIMQAIDALEHEPDQKGKPLSGILNKYRSIRAASQRYRIIYRIDVEAVQVYILVVGPRKQGEKADIYALAAKILRNGLMMLLLL